MARDLTTVNSTLQEVTAKEADWETKIQATDAAADVLAAATQAYEDAKTAEAAAHAAADAANTAYITAFGAVASPV
jgi:hypothetical protein